MTAALEDVKENTMTYLAINLSRIVFLPENIEQLFVRDLRGVIFKLYSFCMPCFAGAHFVVCRLHSLAHCITDCCLGDTRNTLVRQFHAPETPGRKCRLLRRHCHSKISSSKKVLELPSSQELYTEKKNSTSLPYCSPNHNLKKQDSTAKISHATACFFTSRKEREREREREREKERKKERKKSLKSR
jgi:hypothetical protein